MTKSEIVLRILILIMAVAPAFLIALLPLIAPH